MDIGLKGEKPYADTKAVQTVTVPYVLIEILAAFILTAFAVGFWIGRFFPEAANIGEALVVDTIESRFSRPHVLLNNVTLEIEGGTTQIDHILIADTGIFVIETKHFSGWVFGDPYERQWTQVRFKKKFRFQNPIHQNYGHLKAIQGFFKLPEDNFTSLVVFTADAEFKTDVGPSVLKVSELMRNLNSNRPVVFDEKKMAYVVGRIEMKRLRRSIETDEYHRNFVQQRIHGRAMARV